MTAQQGQITSLGAETLATWTELTQRIGHDLIRMSASLAEETTRSTTEIQQATLGAWRDAQAAALRWQTLWPVALLDPLRWSQQVFEHAIGTMHGAMDVGRRNAETMMHAFDRLHSQSEQTARTLQDTFRDGTTKIRDIQSRSERAEAA